MTAAVSMLNSLSDEQRASIGLVGWRVEERHWWAMYHRLHRMKWKVLRALEAGHVVTGDGEDVTVTRDWYLTQLALAGRPEHAPRTGAAAGDATDVPTPAKRRYRNASAPKGRDRKARPTIDPDATPGYRTKTLKRPYHDYLGFHLSVLVEVPEGSSGDYHPGYAISVSVAPANPNHNEVMLGMLDEAERAGFGVGELTVDRGYYGDPFTSGLAERDVRLNMALKEDDQVVHGGQPGVIYIGHVPYDDRMPEPWRNVKAPALDAPVIERARYEAFCDLRWEWYGYRRMTNPDAKGRVRWRSPLDDGRAYCASMPETRHLVDRYPEVVLAPGEKPRRTITTYHSDLPMRQQYVPYGQRHAAAVAHRAAAERFYSLLKTWWCKGMNHGEWHAVHGATNFAFFVGPALCGMNDHLGSIARWRIDIGLDPGEDPDEAPASGDPPRVARAA